MNSRPRLGVLPVYHGSGHATERFFAFLDEQLGLAAPPRLFALCLDCSDIDPHETAETTVVIAWGLEYLGETLVYLRDPTNGQRSLGLFATAADACAYYSTFGALRLTYA